MRERNPLLDGRKPLANARRFARLPGPPPCVGRSDCSSGKASLLTREKSVIKRTRSLFGHDWSKRCTFSLSCRPAANRVFAGPSRFGFPVFVSIFRRISFARPSRDKQLWRQYRFLLGRDAQFHGSASCDWTSRSHRRFSDWESNSIKSAFGSKILRCKHVGQFGWFHVLLKMVREFVRHLLWFGQLTSRASSCF